MNEQPQHPLSYHVLQSMTILIDCGFATYGGFTEEQLIAKSEIYAYLCAEHQEITPEILRETTLRYARGQVTRWKDGAHVPVPIVFPTAPEYVDACKQTYLEMYQMICVGEEINAEGYCITHCIRVKRGILPEELNQLIHRERIRRGLPVPEPHTPMTDAQRKRANALIQRTFGDDIEL